MDTQMIEAAPAAEERNLSVLAYANGFTLWHYKAGTQTRADVCRNGFFRSCPDMLSVGDIIMVSASDGSAVLPVIDDAATVAELAPSATNSGAALYQAACEAELEATRAASIHPPMNSAHEGFAVLLEEVDELKAHVWTKQSSRDLPEMRQEAIQVAAMALRFATECCGETRGRV